MRLEYKVAGQIPQRAIIPYKWEESELDNALAFIRELHRTSVDENGFLKKSLLQAIEDTSLTSSKESKREVFISTWRESAEDFKQVLMVGRNQIKESTWRDNYKPFIDYAISLLEGKNKPKDGYELLKQVILNWEEYPSSRFAACIALRGWMDHAVGRNNIPYSYLITREAIKDFRGKAPDKQDKFVFTDQEIIDFIAAIEERDKPWANVMKLLALYGIRPVELSFLDARLNVDGEIQMHCSYIKVSGKNRTAARWLEEVPLQNEQGAKVTWDLAQQMHEGKLEFPVGKTGEPYERFDAITVRNFLRYAPEWIELKKKYAPRFEVKPYSFRDSWITRATALGIPDPIICRACGHGLVTHSRNYQLASDRTTRREFQKIQ